MMRGLLPALLLLAAACGSDGDSKPIVTFDARPAVDAKGGVDAAPVGDAAAASDGPGADARPTPDAAAPGIDAAPPPPDAPPLPDAAPPIDGHGGNTSPTLVVNGTATTDEDTALTIHLDVDDADGNAGALVVTATSSNSDLFPSGSIVLGGSGKARTITLTPAAQLHGSAVISIHVSDGTDGADATVAVTVTSVNDDPVLAALSNVTLEEDDGGQVTLTVTDDSVLSGLTIMAASDNQGLIADQAFMLTGTGGTRTLTFTPVHNASGVVNVTVTVMDGEGGEASASFMVTVNAVDDPPTLKALADLSIPMNSATNPFTLVFADVDTPLADLTVTIDDDDHTLLPLSGIAYGLPSGEHDVRLTPAIGQSGSTKVTVSITDGSSVVSRTFTLGVTTPTNMAPTIAAIADQDLTINTDVQIPLDVDDDHTPKLQLVVTATSPDATLFPSGSLVVVVSAATGGLALNVDPAADEIGTTTITVTVADEENAQASRQFMINVHVPANTAPTISNISDQNIDEDSLTDPLPFTIGDTQTAANLLTVTAVSDNPGLVAPGGIELGGTDAARTIKITPVGTKWGEANITITVSDGSLMATESFKVTVAFKDDPPVATAVENPTVYAGSQVQIILTGTDEENAALTAATTSSPAQGAFGIDTSGAAPFALTYYANPDATGTDTFKFVVNDGNSNSAEVTVTINIQYCGDGSVNGPEKCEPEQSLVVTHEKCSPTTCRPVGDCDGDGDTGGDGGYESDLLSDEGACGHCGTVCGGIESCNEGLCGYEPGCGAVFLAEGPHSVHTMHISACTSLYAVNGVLDVHASGDITIEGNIYMGGGQGASSFGAHGDTYYHQAIGGSTGFPPQPGYQVPGPNGASGGGGGNFGPSERGHDGTGATVEYRGHGGNWGGGGTGDSGSGGGGGHAGGGGGGSAESTGGAGGGSDGGGGGNSAGGAGGQSLVVEYVGGAGGSGPNSVSGSGGGGGGIGTAAAMDLGVSSTFYPGSGGGGGGNRNSVIFIPNNSAPGSGGGGGGALRLIADGELKVSGSISATGGNGGNGYVGNFASGGGGGGGSGGLIYLTGKQQLLIAGSLDVRGGLGGLGGSPGSGDGGAGSPGRIYLEYQDSCQINPGPVFIKEGVEPFVNMANPCNSISAPLKVYVYNNN